LDKVAENPNFQEKENKRNQMNQLSKLVGLWQFRIDTPVEKSAKFVRFDRAVSHWYFFDKINSAPILEGFAPNIKRTRVFANFDGDNTLRIEMKVNEIGESHFICRSFYFDFPQNEPITGITGTMFSTRPKRVTTEIMDMGYLVGPPCDWKNSERGLFSGVRVW